MKLIHAAMLILQFIILISSAAAAATGGGSGAARNATMPTPSTGPAVSLKSLEQQFMQWVNYIGSIRHSLASNSSTPANKAVAHSVIVVDKRPGVGHFTTVQAAVNSIPDGNVQRVKILIGPGVYMEKVFIPRTKPFITMQGSGNTTIEWADSANMLGADGNPIGTYNTATVGIDASYFIAKNITFRNNAPLPTIGSNNQQAVALRISGDAAVFFGCKFYGTQDTLYDHKGRHYFQDCYVEGSVDFIFGDALSMYKNCHLHAIGAPYQEALTAQNRVSPQEDTGFSFVNCKVTGSGAVFLGRAWGTFSRVVYSFTYMDSIIIPKGWNDWGDPKRQSTVYYGEFRCYGPGANSAGRVPWSKVLSIEEAEPFVALSFIDGTEWFPN